MNIMHLVQADPFATPAGTETFVKNLSLELLKLGCNVHVLYGGTSYGQQIIDKKGVNLHGLAHRRTKLIGGLDYNLTLKRALSKLTNEYVFDVVGCHGAGQAYAFSRIKKNGRTLLVYHAHDCIASEYLYRKISFWNKPLESIRYNVLINLEKRACIHADLIISNSHATENALRENYDLHSEKVKTIYLGIPDGFANGYKSTDPEIPSFLHIATHHERKGTKYLIEALKILYEKYQIKARALIVGKKDLKYINMARQMHVSADFVGYVSEEKLKELYNSCTCLVVPSLRESFCLPVIEAASFEKMTIVSNAGSLPELVSDGETGFVVNVGDVNALASKMYLVTVDDRLRRKLGANAKVRSQLFKMSEIAKQTVNSYRSDKSPYTKEFKR